MEDSIKILYWNAQSLTRKRRQLELLLRERNIDVALISETFLESRKKFKLPNYLIYRKDEVSQIGRPYRGILVAVHRRLVHQSLTITEHSSFQTVGVLLNLNGRRMKVFAIYKPPLEKLKPQELRGLLDAEVPTFIAGDLNSKHPLWNSTKTCANGRILYNDAQTYQYEVTGPDSWTHYPDTGADGDVIDIVVHRGIEASINLEVINDLDSDHRPVLATLSGLPSRVLIQRNRKKIDWDIFKDRLEEEIVIQPVNSVEDVERATEALTTSFREAMTAATSDLPPKKTQDSLPAFIRKLIIEKRETRRMWQDTRCPRLKTKLNRLIIEVKDALDEHASTMWEKHIDDVCEETPSVHRLCRQLRSEQAPIQPLTGKDGLLKFEAADRAEILAESLEEQFSPNPAKDEAHAASITRQVTEYLATQEEEENEQKVFFSPGEVQKRARGLPRRKAAGLDEIPNEALRHLPRKGIVALTTLFNGIMRSCHFPVRWKTAKVVMIPKPGKDLRKPESYRPISLLSTTSKLFEKLLIQHLGPHLKPREEQFGFRAGHSTTLQVARVVNEMAVSYNKKENVAIVLLDMEKAFDRVWHEGLIHKMSNSTAPRSLIKTVASYLDGRRFQVTIEGVLSEPRPVKAGVPQGSCIAPICYAWYTDDIPVVGQAKLALYADDAAYYASSYKPEYAVKRLQPTLDALPEWLDKWRMSVNVSKTQALLSGNTHLPTQLTLRNQTIPWQPYVKYLGITIDRRLSFDKHTTQIIGQAKGARAKLIPVLRSNLPTRTKLMVYKTYIRPRLTYAAPAWYILTNKRNKDRLQAQENLVLRNIVGAPRFVRNETIRQNLKQEALQTFINRLATNLFRRADESQHQHLNQIAPQHARPPDQPGRRKTKPYLRELLDAV